MDNETLLPEGDLSHVQAEFEWDHMLEPPSNRNEWRRVKQQLREGVPEGDWLAFEEKWRSQKMPLVKAPPEEQDTYASDWINDVIRLLVKGGYKPVVIELPGNLPTWTCKPEVITTTAGVGGFAD